MTREAGGGQTVAVIGAAGAMGRIVVRDLAETAPRHVRILALDRDARAARSLFGRLARVTVVEADATRHAAVVRTITGSRVLVNACHHSLNLPLMDVALAARCHYGDLGGLFHVTREQLRRNREFRRAGLLALCGIGSAPGIVNVMARAGADRLTTVEEIHIAVGTIDRTPRRGVSLLETSYTIDTVLDEASQPAAVFTGGKLVFVPPLSGAGPVRFPAPVGVQYPARTIHSELATLPKSFRSKGVREVSFRIAFPGDLADRLRFIHALGLTSRVPVALQERTVVPRDVLRALLARAPRPEAAGPRDEFEVLRVTLRGRRGRVRAEDVLDCLVPGLPAWDIGVDIDTGAPPSIAAQMLLDGRIDATGVLPPETAVPQAPFFRELGRRRMTVVRRTRRG